MKKYALYGEQIKTNIDDMVNDASRYGFCSTPIEHVFYTC